MEDLRKTLPKAQVKNGLLANMTGRVDSWLADPEYFDGEKLTIPFPETKNYVEKVLKAYEKYKETDE